MTTIMDIAITVINESFCRKLWQASSVMIVILLFSCPAPAQEPTVSVGSDTALTQSNVVLPVTLSGIGDSTLAVELELQADSTLAQFLGIVISQEAGILSTVSNIESVSVQLQDGQGSVHQVLLIEDRMRIAVADSVPLQDGLLCYITVEAEQVGTAQIQVTHTVQNTDIDLMTTESGSLVIYDRQVADLNGDGVQDAQDAFILANQVIHEPSWQGRGNQPGWPLWKFRLADRNRDGYLQMIDSSLILQGE